MGKLSLEYVSKDLTLVERDFFDSIGKQIQRSEKDIPWKQRKKYKLEVSKKAQEYVLSLIDVKSNQEIKRVTMHAEKSLQELEARLLIELTQSMERQALQAALDIQRDFKDAQELAKKLDPEDEEFHEEYLKDIRNSALSNLKDIARLKERGL
ncbi:MAG TPA: hypothetical protein PKM32_01800 [Planctomycetota bacterium]|jgi:DNA primase large subunit|nr:hypothetical protein [Planctomycetota bacterium]HON45296.1 hypothetical protein [Planctomycetota bacterium]HPY74462.1 hypothetical protein [Planctomycetota bacterium]HQB00014.1 hypothetical protein [Planctomycetota bacterium]HRU50942.1 hypothetical protein [Planctomycetota bacterium]